MWNESFFSAQQLKRDPLDSPRGFLSQVFRADVSIAFLADLSVRCRLHQRRVKPFLSRLLNRRVRLPESHHRGYACGGSDVHDSVGLYTRQTNQPWRRNGWSRQGAFAGRCATRARFTCLDCPNRLCNWVRAVLVQPNSAASRECGQHGSVGGNRAVRHHWRRSAVVLPMRPLKPAGCLTSA